MQAPTGGKRPANSKLRQFIDSGGNASKSEAEESKAVYSKLEQCSASEEKQSKSELEESGAAHSKLKH